MLRSSPERYTPLAHRCAFRVGPLVLLMLGIGGAWIAHLTALEPFAPLVHRGDAVVPRLGVPSSLPAAAGLRAGALRVRGRSCCSVSDGFAIVALALLMLLLVPWLAPFFL